MTPPAPAESADEASLDGGGEVVLSDVPPAAANRVFADRLPLAERFGRQLATVGVQRGLLGPREAPRLWDRHLLNSAVVSELLPLGAHVVDVGSGAGLPGLALACRRPDLRIDLVDPALRRTVFLAETIELLDMSDRVRVVRGRAEEASVRAEVGLAAFVTARAVASLAQLVTWCLPLLASPGRADGRSHRDGGTLLAIKGERVADEIGAARVALRRTGASSPIVVQCGVGLISPTTTVVCVRKSMPTRSV